MRDITTGRVDYLVAAPKFIQAIPRTGFLDTRRKTGWVIRAAVFYKSEPHRPIEGLIVTARAHQAPVGLPHPTPSAALEWYGHRIRGLNYEQWHDNPDGTSVRGWHEHLWSPAEQDSRVIQAMPEPKDKTLRGLLRWGLAKWNIEAKQVQESLNGED